MIIVATRMIAEDEGVELQIDEMKYGHWKYHRGRYVDGVWIFEGIESVNYLEKKQWSLEWLIL